MTAAARLGVVAALVVGTAAGVVVTAAPATAAVPSVIARTAGTVTADALPTAQIDGVVWSQKLLGNTVYVGGSFATARPAGSAAGVNTVPRPNLMSYDVTTGVMTPWAPVLNNQVYAVAASPDGTRLYVAGQFTTVNGLSRQRIAAFDTATGALVASFAPKINYVVKALAVTNTTVYAGGSFASVGTATRSRLAAFDAASGALLPWNPGADAQVNALTLTPDGSKLIVGGAFQNVGGAAAYGLAAVDPTTGAVLPWAAGATVRNAGTAAAILSLSTDGTAIYGSGYVFGAGGNLEGAFAADPNTGAIIWVEDCHGDTYGVFSTGSTVYTVSHSHYCTTVGGYPETNPRSYQHALAWTPQATGTLGHNQYGGYTDWFGKPAPSMQAWFPDLEVGSYTGVTQAAWSVDGDSRYVVLGGEFPKVNGTAQQGLVRFAVDAIAPDKQGPVVSGANWTPTATSLGSGLRVSFPANWDRDDTTLTYTVIRNGDTTSPAARLTATSTFWNRPALGFVDTGVAPGASATYRVVATDPAGNQVSSASVTGTAGPGTTAGAYAKAVVTDGASHYWRLDETTGSTAYDQAGFDDLTSAGGLVGGQSSALNTDADAAMQFSGTSNGFAATTTPIAGPDVFTEEAWVKTTSTSGGKIVGFGSSSTGTSGSYDRHVYLDASGRVYFGVYTGASQTLRSAAPINDGQWHQVVASMDAGGMTLYVDGKRIGRNAAVTSGTPYAGYWRVGGDSTWSGAQFLAGSIDEVAIYPKALTASQVEQHYALSGRTLTGSPAPTDRYGTAVTATAPDSFLRLDDTTGPTVLDSSGNGASGAATASVTYRVPSPVTGTAGTGVRLDGVEGSGLAVGPYSNPTVYSEELWFSTTTTRGGKLIGFGSSASGRSGSYDRHVYMETDGRLTFGTYTGTANTVTSPTAYNDGRWHHLVATQGPAGMRLYVDDTVVGSNAVTAAQNYDGYWRIGGDTAWNNTAYFAGSIDEVAIYSTALTADQVDAHFHASPVGGIRNQLPTARMTTAATDLTARLDGSASTDPDGTVVSYAWTFGDGSTGSGVAPTHTYDTAGTYPVGLTVTDDLGGTASTTGTVTVTAPNVAPNAVFSQTTTGLSAAFDATGSTDTDGTVVGYGWDFGDGTTGTGSTPTHVYAAGGSYRVVLTATDDDGATATATGQVTVVAPVPTTFATDAFGRTVAKGWGSAEVGGAWTVKGPTAASWTVGNGRGSAVLPIGYTATAELPAVSALDSDTAADVTLDKVPTGGGAMLWIGSRHVGTSEYRVRAKVAATGAVEVSLRKIVNGTDTALASATVAGLTFTAGATLRLRLLVTGTSTVSLAGKVWDASGAEPATWQLAATDSTAPLGAGSTVLAAYVSASATAAQTWSVDNLTSVRP